MENLELLNATKEMMAKMYASQEEMKAIHADRNSLKEEAM
jgi:hypothetical protein